MRITFTQLVNSIYRRAAFTEPYEACTKASLSLRNEQDCSLLNELNNPDNECGVSVVEGEISPGNAVLLEIQDPPHSMGWLYKDINEFLVNTKNLYHEPENYFLIKEDFYTQDTHIPDIILRYRQILSFIQLMQHKHPGIYFDRNFGQFIFCSTELLELPIHYTIANLEALNTDILDELLNYFNDPPTHSNQKLEILVKIMHETTQYQDKKERFSYLLEHLREVKMKFEDEFFT